MRIKRNYYTIEVPSDCETDPDTRFELAYMQAEECTRRYFMPCNWRLISDDGENVRLVREHR
mgnify:FL=1